MSKMVLNVVIKAICVVFCLIILLKVFGFNLHSNISSLLYKQIRKSSSTQQCLHKCCTIERNSLVEQRNHISKLLNQRQKVNGQMKCNLTVESNTSDYQTTEAGGWCANASKTKHFGFDKALATTLALFFKGKTVGSFGDGPGAYRLAILATGFIKVYDAFDGAPFCEDISNGSVRFLDLSIPQYGLPVYDWILCLEVAEHIPEDFEEILIDNIKRHAREGVILSWARPGQRGYSHVNNRSPEYIIEKMKKNDFFHDPDETEKIRNGSRLKHLRRNINVFLRKERNDFAVNA